MAYTVSLRRGITTLSVRQVDLMLAAMAIVAVGTGIASWAVGTGWSKPLTVTHSISGLSLLVLTPLKVRGSVRRGLRRHRWSRWLSIAMGGLVLAAIALGIAHATGAWFGIGYWSALWTHQLFAFVLLPLLLWHILSRPGRPHRTDLDRRAFIGGTASVAAAGAIFGVQEIALRATPLAGGSRRFTGSHEIASFDPANMPTVQWINDTRPSTPLDEWNLRIDGERVDPDQLWEDAQPLEAVLDCTGGWWTKQNWDVVPITDLLPGIQTRSFKVTSSTGYSRLFPAGNTDRTYLAVGYGGQPLRSGHGAPARIVAPGRRGPWWVKWVTEINTDDRIWWAQFPFPLS